MTFPSDSELATLVGAPAAALDFGGTNIDVLVCRDGTFARRFVPAGQRPTPEYVCSLLAACGIGEPGALKWIAVTGGRYRELPDAIAGAPVLKVEELRAIGRGGLVASGLDEALVVSLGTGTALVGARGHELRHYGGSGVGGGTLLGLGRLLLGTADATSIDALARVGDPNEMDLTVGDIVGGPVGMIPASAIASHFGKAAGVVEGTWVGHEEQVGREHVAAALVNLIGQAIVRIAGLAAAANGYPRVVLTGHLADLESFRDAAGVIGGLFGGRMVVPPHPGFAIALGALIAGTESGYAGA